MPFAVFSDIHANWEALETALAYVRDKKIDRFVVLGDTVGYGANPNECFEWAIGHAGIYVVGNHEKAVTDAGLRDWFNAAAREAILWTEKVMPEDLKKKIAGLPYLKIDKAFTFVHGSPNSPEEFHYVVDPQDAQKSFLAFDSPVCFVGHTHVPSCFCETARSALYLRPGILKLEDGERYLLNPGSIGQPRDRDWRLAFGIFDEDKKTFEIVRLDYDNRTAAEKIRRAGLPRAFADRLLG